MLVAGLEVEDLALGFRCGIPGCLLPTVRRTIPCFFLSAGVRN